MLFHSSTAKAVVPAKADRRGSGLAREVAEREDEVSDRPTTHRLGPNALTA
jgi:hypothetical protein